jgi:hypothetical protein
MKQVESQKYFLAKGQGLTPDIKQAFLFQKDDIDEFFKAKNEKELSDRFIHQIDINGNIINKSDKIKLVSNLKEEFRLIVENQHRKIKTPIGKWSDNKDEIEKALSAFQRTEKNKAMVYYIQKRVSK